MGRGIIAIPQQQFAGSSRASQKLAKFHNVAERADAVALEIAESPAPHRSLSGMFARFFPKADQKRVRGGAVSIVAGAAGSSGGGLRYKEAWTRCSMRLPRHVVWPARSLTFDIGILTKGASRGSVATLASSGHRTVTAVPQRSHHSRSIAGIKKNLRAGLPESRRLQRVGVGLSRLRRHELFEHLSELLLGRSQDAPDTCDTPPSVRERRHCGG